MSQRTVYLDNNATTQVAPEVLEEMLPFFSELYGNPSSMHAFGGQVGHSIDEARARVAAGLGCEPGEILFNACGTEGDNTAIHSALSAQPDKRHIITTRVEHPAVLTVAQKLEKRGYDVTYLGVDEHGRLDLDELRDSLRDDTALVSVMYANNEVGNVYPLPEIAQIVKERGALLHTDAVQAVGKISIDLAKLPVDFLALSGHKLHAPKGVGALFVRRGTRFRPFLLGGHQERGRRAGTENTAGIVALGKAMELATSHIEEENTRVKALRDRLEKGLMSAIPDTRLNGDPEHRLPNTANISFKYVEGEAILLLMDRLGICASSGSACTSGSLEPSHVLRAMGVPFTFAHGSIRFSLSRYNTDADVDLVLAEMPAIIKRLREISPFRNGDGPELPPCTC
ncbi:cysteine desulfurase [Desulfobaculum xiamenense]|uniref:Cysteine desulfurase n=1 Tax=Desulfobaculum xiamenense TaxID=995050 RepID=A0A846QV06_9BACT|nr:cysteine desulfurase NifS [Desulfobaculum xiamenense]NJB68944.1 cysteine desulfurase [Desulfobaculum xiamenense]